MKIRPLNLAYIPLVITGLILLSSCEETLFETDISNESVTILAPLEGSQLDITSISFNWTEVDQADSYQIQIATPNFGSAQQIVTDVVLDSITSYSTQLNPNDYQWRVRALNSAYQTGYSTASFRVLSNDDFENNTVVLQSPGDGLITNELEQLLQWDDVLEATSYDIEIVDNNNSQVIDNQTANISQLSYTFLEGDYSWQVRAEKDGVFTLFTTRSLLTDQTPPDVPTLVSPKDQASLSESLVSFMWDRTPVAGSVEIDSIYIYEDQNLTTLVSKDQVSSPYDLDLSNGTYYWLMQAFDQAGNQSDSSEIFTFTIN